MNITGLEVIRGNSMRPSPGQPTPIEVAPPEKLELTYGDTLRITVGFDYRGAAINFTLRCAIGNKGVTFDEKAFATKAISLPASADFITYTAFADISTAGMAPQANYDLYAKLIGLPGEDKYTPYYLDVIDITGMPPTFELLEETIYPYAYIYNGPHDGGVFTFKCDPFTPASWISGKMAATVEDEVRKAGGRLLEMRVYVDRSPLLWTDWRIEVVTVPAKTTAGVAMPLGVVWWVAIILVALSIALLIIVITWAAKEIAGLFKRKPGLDEVKVGWGKDTLISTIQDSEEYWERTPTPLETLQGMSEDDLRHLLNKIAEEEVAPEAGIGLGLAIAAVGVLGLGALAVMAMGKPKERR